MAKEKKVEQITDMEVDFAQWFTDVCIKAELVDYSDVKGLFIMRPYGYAIWENIQKILDGKFKATGHQNVAMPMLIPESLLQKEKDHVEGFAPECAWVTMGGSEELPERLCVRPTSETLFCQHWSHIVHSWRDLPCLYNQWCSVVRWEKTTRPFLRGREFLWQEGHTLHATEAEARKETLQMLEIYAETCEQELAMPVIRGNKTDKEKFAGAENTYTIECMMHDHKALQSGTSHYFGDGFARAFDITYTDKNNQQAYPHQTSWGLSTRVIGGLIMTHADDEGMAVPPRIAPYQVVLVPVIKNEADREKIMAYIEEVKASLKGLTPFGEKVRIKVDNRNKSSVDKFWEWTRKGAPVICEIGMRDAEGGKVMVKERLKLGTPEGKEIIAREEFARGLSERLENIQHEMFVRAKARLENNIRTDIVTHEEFEKYFANANRFIKDGDKNAVTFVRGKWSGDPNSEELLKALKITIRCIPFDQSGSKGECLLTGAKDATVDVIYARSY